MSTTSTDLDSATKLARISDEILIIAQNSDVMYRQNPAFSDTNTHCDPFLFAANFGFERSNQGGPITSCESDHGYVMASTDRLKIYVAAQLAYRHAMRAELAFAILSELKISGSAYSKINLLFNPSHSVQSEDGTAGLRGVFTATFYDLDGLKVEDTSESFTGLLNEDWPEYYTAFFPVTFSLFVINVDIESSQLKKMDQYLQSYDSFSGNQVFLELFGEGF